MFQLGSECVEDYVTTFLMFTTYLRNREVHTLKSSDAPTVVINLSILLPIPASWSISQLLLVGTISQAKSKNPCSHKVAVPSEYIFRKTGYNFGIRLILYLQLKENKCYHHSHNSCSVGFCFNITNLNFVFCLDIHSKHHTNQSYMP